MKRSEEKMTISEFGGVVSKINVELGYVELVAMDPNTEQFIEVGCTMT